ncbi:MAG: CHAT domain-containing protein [Saprospiraceae bacterium]|nr:CHAT domain-containing protein [Saprospiraceae bacterium]
MRHFFHAIACWVLLCIACKLENSHHPSEADLIQFRDSVITAANDPLKLYPRLNQFREALEASEASEPGRYDSLLADACHNIGSTILDYALNDSKKLETARSLLSEGLRLRKRLFQGDLGQKDILRSYCMLGMSYKKSQNLDSRNALRYLADSTRLCPWNAATAEPHIFALSQAGHVCLSVGELISAKALFQAAYDSVYLYKHTVDTIILTEFFKFYTSCSKQLKDYSLALKLCKESKEFIPDKPTKHGDVEALTGNIWQDSSVSITQPILQAQIRDKASTHIFKAYLLYKSAGDADGDARAVLAMGNLGSLYNLSKRYDQTIDLLSNTLKDTAFIQLPPEAFAYLHMMLGDAHCAQGNLEKGITHYHKVIQCLTPAGKKGELRDFKVEDRPDLLYAYGAIAKTELLLYHQRQNPEILPRVMLAYDSLVLFTNLTRSELMTDPTKFELAENSQEALENAVGVCAQLYQITSEEIYKTKAFSFAEQSKGFALLEAVRLRQLGAANPDQIERQKSALKETLISEFQHGLLAPDQGLVSYFMQDTVLHIFLIKPNTLIWKQSVLQRDSLNQWVQEFLNLLQDQEQIVRLDPVKEQERGILGHKLYQLLLSPLEGLLPPRLVILPSAPFLALPFDVLSKYPFAGSLEQQVLDSNFVIFHHSISYDVSANTWAEVQKAKTASGLLPKVAAFAPAFNLSSDPSELARILAKMINTPIELKRLSQVVPADLFLDSNATKSAFIKASRKFNVLHLASHSICDDRNPNQSLLAFNQADSTVDTSQLLYLRELYSLDLDQDLIVLSACETSRGEFALGEGNLSIARGLSYAGAHSFISTLWVINTEPSIAIMPAFYQHLQENKYKDVALAEAKRAYIRESPKNYAPLNWAGIVLNGSTQPIDFSDSDQEGQWLKWIVGLFVAFGLVFVWRRHQRK